jgi:hypothetical protein
MRWVVLEKVLGIGAVRSWPYLIAKHSQVQVEVDGISCPLRCPTTLDVGLTCRVLGSGRFFLTSLPSLSLEESLPLRARTPRLSGWSPEPLDRCRLI